MFSAEPDAGLELMIPRSWFEPKSRVRNLTNSATQEPLLGFHLHGQNSYFQLAATCQENSLLGAFDRVFQDCALRKGPGVQAHKRSFKSIWEMIPETSGGHPELKFLLDYVIDTHPSDSIKQRHTHMYIGFLKIAKISIFVIQVKCLNSVFTKGAKQHSCMLLES